MLDASSLVYNCTPNYTNSLNLYASKQGLRERERAPGHNLGTSPCDVSIIFALVGGAGSE